MPTTAQTKFSLDDLEIPCYFPYIAYKNLRHWEALRKLGPTLSLSKGYTIHTSAGATYCYLVLEGSIEALVKTRNGLINQSAFFMEGSLFQEPSALTKLPSDVTYKAITSAKVVRITRNDLKKAMMANGKVFDFVINSMTIKMNAAREQLRETKLLDVRARVYFMLLGIAATCSEAKGDGWHHLTLKLTQQQMSDMLGVNRVTVNTALQELYDANVVKKCDARYAVFDGRGMLQQVTPVSR